MGPKITRTSSGVIVYRIWADYNNFSEDDRIRLNTVGALEDMKQIPDLHEGMKVTVYDDEIEVDVVLVRVGGIWQGEIASEYREISSGSTITFNDLGTS